MTSIDDATSTHVRTLSPKVPHVAAAFWLVKVLTTAMGESLSDYLAAVNLALAGVVGFGGMALALWAQLRRRSYDPLTYWTTVAMVAVFGTMVADGAHVGLHVPYPVSTTACAVGLALVLTAWYRVEGTLSIHSITTRRRETFYWLTVLLTFALGTAAGDLTATTLGMGYLTSGLLFLAAILVPLVAWRLGLSPIAGFWIAYVLTRPIGASFADWFGKSHSLGGLGLGDGPVAAVLILVIAALVGWLARTGVDRPRPVDRPDGPAAWLSRVPFSKQRFHNVAG